MIHIVHVAMKHTAEDSRVFYRECNSLAKQYNVTLMCIGSINNNYKKNNVTVEQIRKNKFPFLFLKYIKRLLTIKGDVLHAHETESFIAILFIKLFRPKTKIIFDVHEYYEMYAQDKNRMLYVRLYFYIFIYIIRPIFLRLCVGVIVVSKEMEQKYEKLNKNIVVIHNFPDTRYLELLKSNNKLSSNYIYLVYHGGISKERGIFRYVELLERLSDKYVMLIIGNFSAKQYKEFNIFLKEKNIQHRFIITGLLGFQETIQYLKNDVIIMGIFLPDTTGQFAISYPLKIFELLVLGIPQICAKHIKIFDEINKRYHIGKTVEYDNVNKQVLAVKQIVNKYDYYKKNLQENKHRYDWCLEEEKLYSFYRSVINH